MGDIHGNYRALVQCLDKVQFDFTSDTLIQLGDIADGYNEVYECVELLLKIENLIAIRGNHDEWFNEFIQTGIHPDNWEQGGKSTAYSYLKLIGKEDSIMRAGNGYISELNPADIPERHQLFFRRQHLYYIDDDNNCFVHAGFNRHLAFKGQPAETYYWDRSLWSQALSFEAFNRNNQPGNRFQMETPFNEIFIGHTSTINWDTDKPMKAANIYNIDTGAGHGHRLTIMDVASKKYWQSDLIHELYEVIPEN